MVNTFEYFTGLRGSHVYSTTGKWKPHIGQKFSFKRKHNNNYDKITVAGKTLLKGQIKVVTVGYIRGELSLHTWYVIQEGVIFQVTFYDMKVKSLPLQDELEILIKFKIIWSKKEKLLKFKTKVEEVYNESILKDEDGDADDHVAHDNDEGLLEIEEKYHGDEKDVEIIYLEK